MSRLLAPAFQWIVFDAVGTLIHPVPDVATTYHHVGWRYGSRLSVAEVKQRFRDTFAREEQLGNAAVRTDEGQEVAYWRRIVAAVLDDVSNFEACFGDLYRHFGQATSWRCFTDVEPTLRRLLATRVKMAVASNFDHRLHPVLDGADSLALRDIGCRVVSSEVGFRKPSRGFYAALLSRLERHADASIPMSDVLVVGDDAVNDVQGAREAGLSVLHLRRDAVAVPGTTLLLQRPWISSLLELESLTS